MMHERPNILETKNVGKFFYEPQKFRVLSNISIEARKGEFLTLVGKSGCGKSTLLYLLSTMDTDYEGEIMIDGQKVTGLSQDKLAPLRNEKIGFVFQFHYLLPEFSCLKNVMIPALRLGNYSRAEIEERAYRKLEMLGLKEQALKPASKLSGGLGLKEQALKPASKLSGGQQQRVAIARALINDPKIIMGDEPTGNLDSKNTQIVFDIFKQLTREFGQTIVAVTHDMDFARASDRTILMQDGEIVERNYQS